MRANSVKVSVIIPIYNEANNVKQLLSQLRMQTFIDVEFLLINDGSTDNTLKIINKYLNKYPDKRFKVFSKKNGGASSARNFGIKRSSGIYIMFKDADDLCSNDYISSYYQTIVNNNTDMAFFGISRLNYKKKKVNWPGMEALNIHGIINGHRLLQLYANQELRGYSFTYISKRSLWSNVKFDEKYSYQEDSLALMELIINNPSLKACMNQKSYYYYIANPHSVTLNPSVNMYWQAVEIDKNVIKKLQNNKFLCDLIPNMYAHNLTNYSTLIGSCLINNDLVNYNKARIGYLNSYKNARIDRGLKFKRYVQMVLLTMNCKFILKKLYQKIMRTD